MRINNITNSQNTYSPNFRAKFVINDDFKNFVKKTVDENPEEIVRLDNALDKLKKVYPDARLELGKGKHKYGERACHSYYVIKNIKNDCRIGTCGPDEVVEAIEELSNPSSKLANAVFFRDAKSSLSEYLNTSFMSNM